MYTISTATLVVGCLVRSNTQFILGHAVVGGVEDGRGGRYSTGVLMFAHNTYVQYTRAHATLHAACRREDHAHNGCQRYVLREWRFT
jgi:hypothetical protein